MPRITIINGPNLNLLGVRETSVYGEKNFEDYLTQLKTEFKDFDITYFQSNIEGEIIDKLHEVGFSADGIVLNAAGYTHTSVSIADAIGAISTDVIEVHISNIYAREEFRHKSLITGKCKGSICGMGLNGYRLALLHLTHSHLR
ncbi:MAG: 3-dehydroquinate dehydratase-2 [Flavobacteriales bacterium]|jgi:3-dehydroquinate dehydratase-2